MMFEGLRRIWGVTRVLMVGCLLACACMTATGGDAPGFRRKLWTSEAGTPADIWAMVQGRAGYLWLGTGNGLYRFDGVRFERFEPLAAERFRSNNITALTMLPDGSLWIGFYYGGASVMRQGHLQHYAAGDSFLSGMVLTFGQTQDGAVWAATEGGLARFDGHQWQSVGADWGFPSKRADWLIVGRDGTLWVTTGDQLVFLRKGSHRFESTDQNVAKYAIVAQAPDGMLWVSDHLHGTRALPGLSADHPQVDQAATLATTEFADSNRLLFDSYGNLWGTHVDVGGIYRVASIGRLAHGASLKPTDVTERIDRTNGLVSDRAVPLLQDAEGTIWAGTNMGLASFHRNSFSVPPLITLGTASDYAMAMDAHGVVWTVNGGTLLRTDGEGSQVIRRDLPDVGAVQFSTNGDLWFIGRNRLLSLHDKTLSTIPLPLPPTITKVEAFAIDPAGEPWLALDEHGLYHRHDGQWTQVEPVESWAKSTPTALATDAAGRLWIGYPDNRLAVFDGHSARVFSANEGLRVGNITTINALGNDVLIGGELGLARLRAGHIESMVSGDDDVFSGITGIAETPTGDLWLNASKGVVRVDAAEVSASFQQPGYRPGYRLFDYRDGLPGIAVQAAMVPSALVDGMHRVWFLTNQGPAWIDPDDLHTNTLPPPVAILGLQADGKRYALDETPRLPKGTDNLQLEYTAASLAIPDRVRFRYKLDGIDTHWQDAGSRRVAFYSNLAPGRYRFHVIAANDDGIWNTQGAEASFTIAPWFFQTPWFHALCLLAGMGLIAGCFAWRTRLAAERVHLKLMERMSERERIARDIHDTLLQGVQGLLLRLQVVLASLTPEDKRSHVLKAAIDQARDMVIEGRGKIIDLRGDSPQYTELVQSILAVGENLASLYPATRFHMTTEGEPRAVLPNAFDEIIDIVREGIRNAFVHGSGTRVDVHVAYDVRSLRVHVTDDGGGIDEAMIRTASELGHWGVVGMQERTARLGGQLSLRRRHPHGTELLLCIPCRAAYRRRNENPNGAALP